MKWWKLLVAVIFMEFVWRSCSWDRRAAKLSRTILWSRCSPARDTHFVQHIFIEQCLPIGDLADTNELIRHRDHRIWLSSIPFCEVQSKSEYTWKILHILQRSLAARCIFPPAYAVTIKLHISVNSSYQFILIFTYIFILFITVNLTMSSSTFFKGLSPSVRTFHTLQ